MKKRSILKDLIIIFAVTVIIMIVILAFIVQKVSDKHIYDESVKSAKMTADILNSVYHELDEDPTDKSLRMFLRTLCVSMDFEYLYTFSIDEEESEYIYYFVVASDDDADDIMEEERNGGISVKVDDIPSGIISASNGSPTLEMFEYDNRFGNVRGWAYPLEIFENGRRVLLGAEFDVSDIEKRVMELALWGIIPALMVVAVLFAAVILIISKRVLSPLHKIALRIGSFTDDYGKVNEPLKVKRNDELGEIANSFNKMSEDIPKMIEDINELNAERVEASVTLDVAKRIQTGIVPERSALDEEAFSVSAAAVPAKKVGGDFYDCFMRDKDHLCFVIGDVSGKGISAAMFMMLTRTEIRLMLKDSHRSPSEILNRVNTDLYEENPEGMFVTVFAATLDITTGKMDYANAGHNPPVLCGKSARFLETDPGTALGVFDDAMIITQSIVLNPNEGILLYTDGVTEAVDKDKDFFGNERLLSLVEMSDKNNISAGTILEAVKTFSEGSEQFDDITVMTVHEKGWDCLSLKPDINEQKRITTLLREKTGDSEGFRKAILACEEAFINIISYSGADEISFSCRFSDQKLSVILTDNGKEFDPLSYTSKKDFEEFDTGGMGISLIKQSSYESFYCRDSGINNLMLSFFEDNGSEG